MASESSIDVDEMAERIDEHRDPETSMCVFFVEFGDSIDPEAFCDEVSTPDDPWRLFGIKTKLADETWDRGGRVISGEYWKLRTVLSHVEDGDVTGASPLTAEVWPEAARMYVKEQCCERRAAEFVRTVGEEYGVEVSFGGNE